MKTFLCRARNNLTPIICMILQTLALPPSSVPVPSPQVHPPNSSPPSPSADPLLSDDDDDDDDDDLLRGTER